MVYTLYIGTFYYINYVPLKIPCSLTFVDRRMNEIKKHDDEPSIICWWTLIYFSFISLKNTFISYVFSMNFIKETLQLQAATQCVVLVPI